MAVIVDAVPCPNAAETVEDDIPCLSDICASAEISTLLKIKIKVLNAMQDPEKSNIKSKQSVLRW
jgi:hypothetical protein